MSTEEAHPAAPANPAEDAAGGPPAPEDLAAFMAGYEQGQRETRALVEEAAVALGQSVDALGDFLKELQARYEPELLGVALGVARKVVHAEVTERPELWLGMIREALQRVADRETVRIRVPHKLAAFLTEHCPALRTQLDGVQELEVVEDPALPDGGCVVETRVAELDASVETQLDEITRALSSDQT
jgi:flagellar assembly protein FliH